MAFAMRPIRRIDRALNAFDLGDHGGPIELALGQYDLQQLVRLETVSAGASSAISTQSSMRNLCSSIITWS